MTVVDEAREMRREQARTMRSASSAPTIEPANTAADRGRNPMRPAYMNEVIGQTAAKDLLTRAIDRAKITGHLDHVMLIGQSGTGKSTFSNVIANEMGVNVYQFEAPLSHETLLGLREVMQDGDILFLDEIHQQSLGDRRGRDATVQPETLYSVLEDHVLPTATGILPFPRITMIGATTDEGMLPDAFLNRFPLKPRLVPYSEDDLVEIAAHNAAVLGHPIAVSGAEAIATSTRGVPREVNNLVKNVCLFVDAGDVIRGHHVAEVLKINGVTIDGLTGDMQAMLVALLNIGRRESKGEVRYQCSVSTIATAIGKSRDQKAIQLRIEPYLLQRGLVSVEAGGRRLTDSGIKRAKELRA